MRYLTCLAIFASALMVTSVAGAGEWDRTFADDSLPEQLTEARVVVAAGGPESAQVSQTLVERLDDAGAPEAMSNPVFDGLGDRSDQQVVDDLEHLPVDVVVVLRTFADEGDSTDQEPHTQPDDEEVTDSPAEQPEPAQRDEDSEGFEDAPETAGRPTASAGTADSAMLTVYSVDGTPVAGFMVYPGEPITAEQREDVGRGISQHTLEAARAAAEGEPIEGAETEHRRRFHLEHHGDEPTLRDRENNERYTGDDIYEKLGEEQLAEEYRDNLAARQEGRSYAAGAGFGGLALTAIGTGMALHYRGQRIEDHPRGEKCEDSISDRQRQNCLDEEHRSVYGPRIVTGYAIAGIGVIATIVGSVVYRQVRNNSIHPVDRTELAEQVEEYEESLVDDDDDSDEEQSMRRRHPRAATVGVSPYIELQQQLGAGINLQVRW